MVHKVPLAAAQMVVLGKSVHVAFLAFANQLFDTQNDLIQAYSCAPPFGARN